MTELKDRLQVDDKRKWDLTDIYDTIEDWESDFHKIEVLTKELHEFNGNIHDGNNLLAYLTKSEEISSIISLMFAYARLQSDLDTRDTDAQSLVDKVSQLHVKVSAAKSFFSPFLLSVDENTLHTYMKKLKAYNIIKKIYLNYTVIKTRIE